MTTLVGKPVRRLEDRPLVTGAGRYVADLFPERPDLLHLAVVRSVYAHARVLAIDTAAAAQAPGVVRVVTATDLADLNGLPPQALPDLPTPPHHPVLAGDRVRFVGDPVAAVVAETPALARDAAALVEVSYEPLPTLVEAEAALADGAPTLHETHPDNVLYRGRITAGDTDAAFARADRVVTVHLRHGRVAPLPIETRGCLAEFDPSTGRTTLWLSTQAPYIARDDLAKVFKIPNEQVRVIAPDVGGGFGLKAGLYREDALAVFLARELGRPVAWIATRSEDLVSGFHGRDMVSHVEAAVMADGTVLAMRARTVANVGAYAFGFTPFPLRRMTAFPTGCYAIANLDAQVVGAFTNTASTGPYRGAGRPEAAFIAERTMDEVAAVLGLDPADVRRRNFIPPDAFPYRTAGGVSYDSGRYEYTMDVALAQAGYPELRKQQAERRARGELVGIGLATYVEVAGGFWESGKITLEPDGTVTAVTGSSPHGQGHRTTFAQIISDVLQVAPDAVHLEHGDTDQLDGAWGTFGSRSVMLGGSALLKASEAVKARALRVASALLEAAAEDLELRNGQVTVRGAPGRALPIRTIIEAARAGTGLEPDEPRELAEALRFQQTDGDTFPYGSALAMVSIERETGRVNVERLLLVDDCGRIINPLLVEGQLQGGAAQGLGESLIEWLRYDEDGQLITGTLMDYAAPRAADIPRLELGHTETPSPRNPLGAKGAGEAGAVGTPAALANAIVDALRPLGLRNVDLPVMPEQLWQVVHSRE